MKPVRKALFASRAALSLGAACALALGVAHAQPNTSLTFVAFGGAAQAAQNTTLFQPFAQGEGVRAISHEYNGELARIKVMVETGNVDWDVVMIEGVDLVRGCEEGLFERLDWQTIGGSDRLIDAAAHPCGSAALVWSTALAYNTERLAAPPNGWVDFWDVAKIPGKRGLRKRGIYNMEIALMADGVAPADVYRVLATPAGVERAFAKLDELKPHIQWWEAGAQPPQWLMAGDVVMSTVYSGRIASANREGAPLAIAWPGNLYGMDYWAIIKGSPNRDLAQRFIAFANQPEAQLRHVSAIEYGPTDRALAASLPPAIAEWAAGTPNNTVGALAMDNTFWADHGEELEERFIAWTMK